MPPRPLGGKLAGWMADPDTTPVSDPRHAAISIVTGCRSRLSFLQRALPTWLALPVSEIIVVDASCPQGTGAWARSLGDPRVRVLDWPGETYRHSAVKNLGWRAAKTPWVALLDADICVDPALAQTFPHLRPGGFYRADSLPEGLAGQFILERATLERLNGFDEVYRDYADEDFDLLRRMLHFGYAHRTFPAALLSHIPHTDDLRIQGQSVPSAQLSLTYNSIYGLAKIELMKLLGQDLTPEFRRNLYDALRAKSAEVVETGQPARIELGLPTTDLKSLALDRTYVLTLRPASVADTRGEGK